MKKKTEPIVDGTFLGPDEIMEVLAMRLHQVRADDVLGVRAVAVLMGAEPESAAAVGDRDTAGSGGGVAAQLGACGACAVVSAVGARPVSNKAVAILSFLRNMPFTTPSARAATGAETAPAA